MVNLPTEHVFSELFKNCDAVAWSSSSTTWTARMRAI
jgi:hypothetical protein